MIEVRRKEKESFGAMLRRFTRRVQTSGLLREARKTRFYTKPATKNRKHVSALRRIEVRREKLRDEKLGKRKEEKKGKGPRRG
ncbi:MAG: hypothetical protein A3H71_00560 [Candidatus Sungbacteria bacterium RIFCSPLOWO2_02_FULL_48_13b]|uniref:Small ribosomal subunit protein bS21 n=2 Tax=Candidatus Sungiibacteriota TaxID=1817917 RepID=A0A1G2LGW5_9BACT|nr:MAG: hypothetical protein A3C12_02915 [Candidatus Sungbacteria bacterium RIFCSPHIGHO2_02_FULL_49_20]OHA10031.1 MAG: hypothetical protein A3H71_00560 [Candidatus Sungbacteria bacterium RIFCSPLOWO2_02_FULL_48_13b]